MSDADHDLDGDFREPALAGLRWFATSFSWWCAILATFCLSRLQPGFSTHGFSPCAPLEMAKAEAKSPAKASSRISSRFSANYQLKLVADDASPAKAGLKTHLVPENVR